MDNSTEILPCENCKNLKSLRDDMQLFCCHKSVFDNPESPISSMLAAFQYSNICHGNNLEPDDSEGKRL
jgi:hypothetical protein